MILGGSALGSVELGGAWVDGLPIPIPPGGGGGGGGGGGTIKSGRWSSYRNYQVSPIPRRDVKKENDSDLELVQVLAQWLGSN